MIQHKLATGLILRHLVLMKFNAWASYWDAIAVMLGGLTVIIAMWRNFI